MLLQKRIKLPVLTACFLGLAITLLAGCEGADIVGEYPDKRKGEASPTYGDKKDTIFGEGGLNLFGDSKKNQPSDGGGIGVNSFLWRASLDTISFMPVNSADPFGGVIITDWHSNVEAPNERFKLNVYILGRSLRADGVRVSVFRQIRDGNDWKNAAVPKGTDIKIEDAILTRARQLRRETVQQ